MICVPYHGFCGRPEHKRSLLKLAKVLNCFETADYIDKFALLLPKVLQIVWMLQTIPEKCVHRVAAECHLEHKSAYSDLAKIM